MYRLVSYLGRNIYNVSNKMYNLNKKPDIKINLKEFFVNFNIDQRICFYREISINTKNLFNNE